MLWCAVTSLIMTGAPVWPVAPGQVGAHPAHDVACDDSRCELSWILENGPVRQLWTAAVGDGGLSGLVGPANLSSSVRLYDLARGLGRRFHLYDVSGSGGDRNVYVSVSADPSTVDDTGAILATDYYSNEGNCAFTPAQALCVAPVRSGSFDDIHFRLFEPDGGAVGPGSTMLHDSNTLAFGPVAVTLDDRVLVTWLDYSSTQYDVLGRMVGFDGGLLLPTFPVSAALTEEDDVAAVSRGATAVVAWTVVEAVPRVVLAEVMLDGTVQALPVSFPGASEPAISWHDDRLLLALERATDGGALVEAHALPWPTLEGGRQVFEAPGTSDTPALARVDASRALLSYRVREPDGGVRAAVTFIGLVAEGAACSEDAQCGQGFACLGSVCAASPEGPGPALAVACGCAGTGAAGAWAAGLGLGVALRRRRGQTSPVSGPGTRA
jgi:hypothetical protein